MQRNTINGRSTAVTDDMRDANVKKLAEIKVAFTKIEKGELGELL